MNPITLGRETIGRIDHVADHEWLVTNGIGGFASSTLGFLNTRRYHGLLFAALRPPVDRVAMVSKLDVTALYGDTEIALSTNEYGDGTVAPQGIRHLESFRLEGLIPVWTWLVQDARFEQRVWMRHGENTTYVRFTRLSGIKPLCLRVEPLCTYRDYHWQLRGQRTVTVERAAAAVHLSVEGAAPAFSILSADAKIEISPQWHWNFKHREESARGLDDLEDLLRPAVITFELRRGHSQSVILTAEPHDPIPAEAALTLERTREDQILARCRAANRLSNPNLALVAIDQLALAADQFVVGRRDSMGIPRGNSIIAGYPWFSDWGRDTMISLPGLTLVTGRSDIAASVLRTFASFVSQGMLPNRFPDAGEPPEYNTADASLWFFVAVHAYLKCTADPAFAAEIYPTLKDIFRWHLRGTRFGIVVDKTDGLLRAGEPGVQLTWMDAKVGDWVVTPRIGKPVEINALWFNAVSILRGLAEELGHSSDARDYAVLADRIGASFEREFWFEGGGYLYDVIDGPEGELDGSGRRRDKTLRPNQIFSLSLPFTLLRGDKAKRMLEKCTTELWTPLGLRSLAPDDPRYIGRYGGAPLERDGAYHQGSVWTWLLGPYITAHYRVYADLSAALELLGAIPAHLHEGCIGQVSVIMDGNAPFEPRGCFAQAWGVAEILRAWNEISHLAQIRQPAAVTVSSPPKPRTTSTP